MYVRTYTTISILLLQMAIMILTYIIHGGSTSCENSEISYVEYNQKVSACSRKLSCLMERLCSNSIKIIKRDTSSMMSECFYYSLFSNNLVTRHN